MLWCEGVGFHWSWLEETAHGDVILVAPLKLYSVKRAENASWPVIAPGSFWMTAILGGGLVVSAVKHFAPFVIWFRRNYDFARILIRPRINLFLSGFEFGLVGDYLLFGFLIC
jgi:hypothetical protein